MQITTIVTDIQALRRPTVRVRHSTDTHDLVGIAEEMFAKMKALGAQGLAANQIGYPDSICVFRRNNMSPVCLVNPKIVKEKGWAESNEGCLSLPGIKVRVRRPVKIRVTGFNQWWEPVNTTFKGIEARRACHEIDHLNGKLIIDYGEAGL